jgi:hypothetical protein
MELGELRAAGARGLLLCCNRCGRMVAADAAPFVARFGARFPVPAVARSCRCSACGSRDVASRPDWEPGPVVTRHTRSEGGACARGASGLPSGQMPPTDAAGGPDGGRA